MEVILHSSQGMVSLPMVVGILHRAMVVAMAAGILNRDTAVE